VTGSRRGRILIVEDAPTIADVVARYLRRAGYEASVVGDGPAAVAAVALLDAPAGCAAPARCCH
jgi:DNA-binding response OmpR family regulator